MAVLSQNGWRAATTYTGHGIPLVPLRWVTGSVRSGDVHTVLDYLGERFNAEVEPIVKTHSWGFAPREIRGKSTTLSNHASGTAVDFNAPRHGIGLSGTFSPQQRKAIERILADLDGTVRWGGHYTGRKDEMHFEINCTAAKLAKVAAKIRKTDHTTPTTLTAPLEEDDMFDDKARAKLDNAAWAIHNTLAPALTRVDQRTYAINAKVAALDGAVDALGQSLGLDPGVVSATVDKAVKDALKGLEITLTTDKE